MNGAASLPWKGLPVSLEAFSAVRQTVLELTGSTPEAKQALLACDEILSNIVAYSGAEELYYFFRKEENQLYFGFMDNGRSFDPTAAQMEEKEFEALDKGGMGLHIVRQIVKTWKYSRQDGRNLLFLLV